MRSCHESERVVLNDRNPAFQKLELIVLITSSTVSKRALNNEYNYWKLQNFIIIEQIKSAINLE